MPVFAIHPAVLAVVEVTGVLVVTYTAYILILRLRPSTCKDDKSVPDLQLDLEEMKYGGDISEEELRKIKAVLEKSQKRE